MLQHCWHDVNVKFPARADSRRERTDAGGAGVLLLRRDQAEPLPPMRPKRAHGPYVDDDSEWYVLDEAECPGQDLVKFNLEPAVVPIEPSPRSRFLSAP